MESRRRVGRCGGAAAVIFSLLLLGMAGGTAALSLTVDGVECVYEYVYYKGDIVSGNFVVEDHTQFWNSDHPGFEFSVTSPEGNTVHSLKGTSGDKFQFRSPTTGIHKFCFHNPTSTPETVTFNIHVGHIPDAHNLAKDEHLDPINVRIAELKEALEHVTLEQRFLKARQNRHRHTYNTARACYILHSRGIPFAGPLSGMQVFYIRRLFSKTVPYGRV